MTAAGDERHSGIEIVEIMENIDVVDPDRIRMLVELMSEHDLSELCLRSGEEEILLKRPGAQAPYAEPARTLPVDSFPLTMGQPQLVVPPSTENGQPAQAPAADENAGLVAIRSPMVGTFYEAPDPQSLPFVTVGSPVSPNTVVCIIEAMKVFNAIKAETTRTVEKVMVKNEDSVEYGQSLFFIRPE